MVITSTELLLLDRVADSANVAVMKFILHDSTLLKVSYVSHDPHAIVSWLASRAYDSEESWTKNIKILISA